MHLSSFRPTVRAVALIAALAVTPVVAVLAASPAHGAQPKPVVTRLSTDHGTYWGGEQLTVYGRNFTDVSAVLFGREQGWSVQVLSSTKLTVREPESALGTWAVRVVTSAGRSALVKADRFTYRYPTMDTPIYGGLTARQEVAISAKVRARHHNVPSAPRAGHWTPGMGRTAARRAHSWLGIPYSWAGGSGSGPTAGVCSHNGGDNDCHVVGFDCSGLALHAWWPYEHLPHYAAYQHAMAGSFHPTIGQLVPGDLVFFTGYIPGGIGHVAIYTGGGMIIQAAESGTTVMRSKLADVIAGDGPYRGATRPMSTGVQGPAPAVYSSTPQLGTGGGTITITGRDLDQVTTVSVAGTMAYHFVHRTASTLVVKAPAHHGGAVGLSVSNAWGTTTRTLTYVGAPHFGTLSPYRGPSAGGTAVTITGRNLAQVRTVKVGSTSVPFHVHGDTELTLRMPKHAAGAVSITAVSPFGTSNQKRFWYVATTPTPTPTPTSTGKAAPTPTRSTRPAGPTTTSAPPSVPTGPPSAPSSAPSSNPVTTTPASAPPTAQPTTEPTPAPTSTQPTSAQPTNGVTSSAATQPATPAG